jgi:hypothetical protein
MALKILDDSISSDRSLHTARLAPGERPAWEVSWLPARHLNRDEAVTAMVLADTTANGDVHPAHRAWPHIEKWAGKLGMTGSQVLSRIAGPPRWASHQERTAGPLAPDQPHVEERGRYQTGPGWRDNDIFEFVRDEAPDWAWDMGPDWDDRPLPGRPADTRRPVPKSSNRVNGRPKERHPHASASLPSAPRAGRFTGPALEPGKQPDQEACRLSEPDRQPDWEAGQ